MYIFFLECKQGQYGPNCDSKCGHCLIDSDCSRIDGTCHTGCNDGYRGPQCYQSMNIV